MTTQLAHAVNVMAAHPELRFAPGLGWFRWDGARWADDAEGDLLAAVQSGALAHPSGNTTDAKHGLTSRQGLADVAIICRDLPRARTRPEELDRCKGKLHTAGVTWDLVTGSSQPSEPDELNTRATSVEPTSSCPRWLAFLDSCFPGEPEMVAYLQRLIGYGITGFGTQHVFVVMHGGGAAGKSTFANALTHAFGQYVLHLPVKVLLATQSQNDTGEAASPQLMRLRAARLVFTSESDREARLNEATVKQLTGGDPLSVRGLYGSGVTFTPEALFFMSTNYLPEIRGTDSGIWRRVKVIEWRESFEDRMDLGLGAALEAEAAGIIGWAIDGALEYARVGLSEPLRVAETTTHYRAESDFFGAFVPDWLRADQSHWMPRTDVLTVWEEFVDQNAGSHLKSNATLYAALRARGLEETKRKGVWGFKAVRTPIGARE